MTQDAYRRPAPSLTIYIGLGPLIGLLPLWALGLSSGPGLSVTVTATLVMAVLAYILGVIPALITGVTMCVASRWFESRWSFAFVSAVVGFLATTACFVALTTLGRLSWSQGMLVIGLIGALPGFICGALAFRCLPPDDRGFARPDHTPS